MKNDLLASQLEELWKLNPERLSKEAFVSRAIKKLRYATVDGKKLLREKDFDTVFYSRTDPIINPEEREIISQKTVLFLGCSTNSPVATALLQQGLKKFILSDPDVIELSNTNRIIGAGVGSLGKNKAEHLSAYLKGIHPYIKTEIYTHVLTDRDLEIVIKKADLIIEMVDDPAVKVTTRLLAKKHKKPVLMITGIGDQPIVVVEQPGDALFHRFKNKDQTDQFFNKQLPVKERFKLYCKIIGTQNLPVSMMVNMILAASGIRSYIAQHGGTAMIAGGLGAYAARELLLGRKIKKEVPVDVPSLLSPASEIKTYETNLWNYLKKQYPSVFLSSDNSLQKALARLFKKLFEIQY